MLKQQPKTVHGYLEIRAGARPDAIALLAPGKADTTFGELTGHLCRTRERLAACGISRGARVALLFNSRDLMATAHLSVTSVATSVPLNQTLPDDELGSSLTRMKVDHVIIEQGMGRHFHDIAQAAGAKVIEAVSSIGQAGLFELRTPEAAGSAAVELARPEDVALLLQTSGTTALPKVVPLEQAVCANTAGTDGTDIKLTSSDRCLNTLPLHHVQGLIVELLIPLLYGASVVLADFSPRSFLGLVRRYKPTYFTLVPSMHRAVVDSVDSPPAAWSEKHLRFVRSSSSTLPLSLRNQLEKFYGVFVNEGYGSSETGNMADLGVDPRDYRAGSVGRRCHPGVVVMDDQANRLQPGQTGEICARGPTVFQGYEDDPEANAESFRDGWYRTGDLGYFDDDDYLYLVGRVRESISRGGERISPEEIDAVLLAHECVAQAAAFAVPHEILGQDVWAAVVLELGAAVEPAGLRAFASQKLSFAKVPKRIFIVDAIPMNSTGKITRRELTTRFAGTQIRDTPP